MKRSPTTPSRPCDLPQTRMDSYLVVTPSPSKKSRIEKQQRKEELLQSLKDVKTEMNQKLRQAKIQHDSDWKLHCAVVKAVLDERKERKNKKEKLKKLKEKRNEHVHMLALEFSQKLHDGFKKQQCMHPDCYCHYTTEEVHEKWKWDVEEEQMDRERELFLKLRWRERIPETAKNRLFYPMLRSKITRSDCESPIK